MIISIHLADVGVPQAIAAMSRPPRPDRGRGLHWAAATVPLAIGHLPPRPRLGQVGLIAAWSGDDALDRFLTDDPWSRHLSTSYEVRLTPMRAVGSWPALPELQRGHDNGSPDEPVGVLTLGRLRASQAVRFLRATAIAERALLTEPALTSAVGLARLPFVATFSLWNTNAGMQEYAYGGDHAHASTRHRAKPFHHESAFARLRPYRTRGTPLT